MLLRLNFGMGSLVAVGGLLNLRAVQFLIAYISLNNASYLIEIPHAAMACFFAACL